jgi:hypothetical protein
MAWARKGNKGWKSPGSELSAENSGGHPEALRRCSWNAMRIWWFPVPSRGKLHIVLFDEGFRGEAPKVAAQPVGKGWSALIVRFHSAASPQKQIVTDWGRGIFFLSGGAITTEYKQAHMDNGLEACIGDSAVRQPGTMQDRLLH